jgi:hypothetical protein
MSCSLRTFGYIAQKTSLQDKIRKVHLNNCLIAVAKSAIFNSS